MMMMMMMMMIIKQCAAIIRCIMAEPWNRANGGSGGDVNGRG
jgi:hypothetical protein